MPVKKPTMHATITDPKREHFRGVVWPRQNLTTPPVRGPEGPVYRYAIVGMLVTDTPLAFENKDPNTISEVVLDGSCPGVAGLLQMVRRGRAVYTLGDATSVLCSLDDGITSLTDDDGQDGDPV